MATYSEHEFPVRNMTVRFVPDGANQGIFSWRSSAVGQPAALSQRATFSIRTPTKNTPSTKARFKLVVPVASHSGTTAPVDNGQYRPSSANPAHQVTIEVSVTSSPYSTEEELQDALSILASMLKAGSSIHTAITSGRPLY